MEYQRFICPVCGENMPEYKDSVEDDTENETKYDKTMYHCKKDDVWVTIEVPMPSDQESS